MVINDSFNCSEIAFCAGEGMVLTGESCVTAELCPQERAGKGI